jgi:hypothetical protein
MLGHVDDGSDGSLPSGVERVVLRLLVQAGKHAPDGKPDDQQIKDQRHLPSRLPANPAPPALQSSRRHDDSGRIAAPVPAASFSSSAHGG